MYYDEDDKRVQMIHQWFYDNPEDSIQTYIDYRSYIAEPMYHMYYLEEALESYNQVDILLMGVNNSEFDIDEDYFCIYSDNISSYSESEMIEMMEEDDDFIKSILDGETDGPDLIGSGNKKLRRNKATRSTKRYFKKGPAAALRRRR